jgi:GNAT superfamily N-acetyltransferase
MTPQTTLQIRPARPEDREAVFAMVATVWDGNDYIPLVWEEWLGDPSGPLLVGEQDGRPAALAKLTGLGAGQDWFEGLRVAPEQRGRGLARTMLGHCIELSRRRGSRVLRYCTSILNTTMHRVADDFGFRLCYLGQWYAAEPLAADEGRKTQDEETPANNRGPAAEVAGFSDQASRDMLEAVGVGRLAELRAQLEGSALLRLTGGLYNYGWLAQELTEERLRGHLERGEVRALPGGRAWVIAPPSERGGWWVAHAEGDPSELAQIFTALRRTPTPPDTAAVRLHLPPGTPWLPALAGAGIARGEHDQHIYELRIEN